VEELHLDMVNSEHFRWLPQGDDTKATQLKPDGFFTVKGLFNKREGPQDGSRKRRDNGFRYCFGVPFRDLQDFIIIFEGKREIDEKAFGEVVQYLQFLVAKLTAGCK
jgi:hypothetical protein